MARTRSDKPWLASFISYRKCSCSSHWLHGVSFGVVDTPNVVCCFFEHEIHGLKHDLSNITRDLSHGPLHQEATKGGHLQQPNKSGRWLRWQLWSWLYSAWLLTQTEKRRKRATVRSRFSVQDTIKNDLNSRARIHDKN